MTQSHVMVVWCPDWPGGDDGGGLSFEPVVAVVEQLVAGVAVLYPGACAFAARGPARYYGGLEAAAERIVEQLAVECEVEAQAGAAAGVFAALLAAKAGQIIKPGQTRAFLADQKVSTLGRPELTNLLYRLGIRTLGDFAALPPSAVLARFGLDAALAQRLAAGRDDRPLAVRRPPPDLVAEERFDEPVERVDMAAFAARALAERLHERLTAYGLACTRLVIETVTSTGRELRREWRHDGVLTAQGIADRTRWQLEGWLTTSGGEGIGALLLLRLIPEGVLRQSGLQSGLWGEPGPGQDRAHRAMTRIQGMLGPDAILIGIPSGGRDPAAMVTPVPWGAEQVPQYPDGPWPGRLPGPYPGVVLPAPVPVRLFDSGGQPVRISARLELSGLPAVLEQDGRTGEVIGWSSPWPVDEAWWTGSQGHRAVRMQVTLADGRAMLLALIAGEWHQVMIFD